MIALSTMTLPNLTPLESWVFVVLTGAYVSLGAYFLVRWLTKGDDE